MEKIIIGIHGLANKPPEEILAKWWKQSIVDGLKNIGVQNPDFNFRMVYWADRLYKLPMHDDSKYSFDSLCNTEPYVAPEAGRLKEYKEGFLDSFRAAALDVIGSGIDALKQNFSLDWVSNLLLNKLVRDLDFYYDQKREIPNVSNQMETANKVLKDELSAAILAEQNKEIMLISHSMGTIISYDVLRNLGQSHPDLKISHFVTLGSPLGLSLVKGKIIQERGYDPQVRTPSIVTKSWMNFSDKKDPVAADIHLNDDYTGNKLGIQVKDDLVLNDYQRPGDKKNNHHKSYGYLRCPEVANHIKAFLES